MKKITMIAVMALVGAGVTSAQVAKQLTSVSLERELVSLEKEVAVVRTNWSQIGTATKTSNYSGQKLENLNMSTTEQQTKLYNSSFEKASLRGSYFESATLSNVSFNDADLSFATFTASTDLSSSTFKSAILDGATLSGTSLYNSVNGSFADFSGAKFSSRTALSEVSFEKVELSGARFIGTDLSKVQNLELATYLVAPEFTKETILPTGFDAKAAGWTEVASVPEPSSTLLLGLGGVALVLRRRK